MEEVVDGHWIVVRRERPFPRLNVKLLIVHQHVVECQSKRMVTVSFEFVIDLLVSEEDMCDLQRNHHQGNVAFNFKDSFKSERITVDIELSCRCDIASFDGTTHEDDFAYLLLDLWEGHQQQAEISQGISIDPHYLFFQTHYFRIHFRKTFNKRCLGRLLYPHSSQSIPSMHNLSRRDLSLNNGIRSRVDIQIRSTNIVKNVECICGSIGQIGVSRGCGDCNKIYVRMMCCVYNGEGVVQPWVAVQPNWNLLLHNYNISYYFSFYLQLTQL